MNEKRILQFLSRTIGVKEESIGQASALRLARARAGELAIREDEYLALLERDPREAGRLVEEVVVGETWFFRDEDPFLFLKKIAGNLLRLAGSPLRVLSAPCATGEEAWSIAASLAGGGLSGRDFRVTGLDVSLRAVETAKKGRYPLHSFRGKTPDARFFRETREGFQVEESLLKTVDFSTANLLKTLEWQGFGPFHVIFCRNLFIYLNPEARDLLRKALDRALAPGGMIFLGYAEARQVFFPNYEAVGPLRAYACQKPPSPRPSEPPRRKPGPLGTSAEKPRNQKPENPAGPGRTWPAPKPGAGIREAALLAGQGRLEEAETLCGKILSLRPDDEEALALLGAVFLARDDHDRAEECFGKALYLNPAHEEALTHMGLLLERKGEFDAARRLRNRLLRGKDAAS